MKFSKFFLATTLLALLASCASSKKMDSSDGVVQTGKEVKKAASKAPSGNEVRCTRGTDERIMVVVAKGDGCELEYTKFGNMNAVASSVSGNAHCVNVQQRIKGKLEAAGYSCK